MVAIGGVVAGTVVAEGALVDAGVMVVAGTVVVAGAVVAGSVVAGAVVVGVVAAVVDATAVVVALEVAPVARRSAGAVAAPTTKSTTPTAPAISFRDGTASDYVRPPRRRPTTTPCLDE